MKTVFNMPTSPAHEPGAGTADAQTGADTLADRAADTVADRARPLSERGHGHRPGSRAQPAAHTLHSAFVPLLLGGLALLGWQGFHTQQLLNDRQALLAAHIAQQQTVDNAGKLRASLDALAADTQRIADAGNANARLLVEELRKRGITINIAAASTGATTSATEKPATR